MSFQKFVRFSNRGQIIVSGPDSYSFLQNIVTQDLDLLKKSPSIHSCLLSPQGKFLYDFFISKDGETYFLDCEGGDRAKELLKRLTLYKLRANIDVHVSDVTSSYQVFPDGPRSFTQPEGEEISFMEWDQWRIKQGIPDGSRDAEIGFSTLAELNLDQHSVSYTKGCYIGQELVARMHNRNLGKKHLVAAKFSGGIPGHGHMIEGYGTMRSSAPPYGLILMTYETEEDIRKKGNQNDQIRLLGL